MDLVVLGFEAFVGMVADAAAVAASFWPVFGPFVLVLTFGPTFCKNSKLSMLCTRANGLAVGRFEKCQQQQKFNQKVNKKVLKKVQKSKKI